MSTEHPEYVQRFEAVTGPTPAHRIVEPAQ
jgi:hypothetical protein